MNFEPSLHWNVLAICHLPGSKQLRSENTSLWSKQLRMCWLMVPPASFGHSSRWKACPPCISMSHLWKLRSLRSLKIWGFFVFSFSKSYVHQKRFSSTLEAVKSSLWSASRHHMSTEPGNNKTHLRLAVASSEFQQCLPPTLCNELIRWRCSSMFEYDIAWLSANIDYGSCRDWFHYKLNGNHQRDLNVSARTCLGGCFLQPGTNENVAPGSFNLYKWTLRMLWLQRVRHKLTQRKCNEETERFRDITPVQFHTSFYHHILCYHAASPLGQVFPNPHLAAYIDQFSPWLHDSTARTPAVNWKWWIFQTLSCVGVAGQATNSIHFQTFPKLSNIPRNSSKS